MLSEQEFTVPSYIARVDKPLPRYDSEVALKGDFGYFPHFDTNFSHGFHWLNPGNVSYWNEDGFDSKNLAVREAAEARVTDAISYMLTGMNMSSIDEAVFAFGKYGNFSIVDIDEKTIAELPANPRERLLEGGAYFTKVKGVPIYAKAGDCTWTFLNATAKDGTAVGGLIHAGRTEADHLFPRQAIYHVINHYEVIPETIKLGIIPSLEPQQHTIMESNYIEAVRNFRGWAPYSLIDPTNGVNYLDLRSFVAGQYLQANRSIKPENVHVLLPGTHESAQMGKGFSYRLAKQLGVSSKRFGVAFQLT